MKPCIRCFTHKRGYFLLSGIQKKLHFISKCIGVFTQKLLIKYQQFLFSKKTIGFVMSVRLSVQMENLGCHWTVFREVFEKTVKKIKVSLKSDKNKGHIT